MPTYLGGRHLFSHWASVVAFCGKRDSGPARSRSSTSAACAIVIFGALFEPALGAACGEGCGALHRLLVHLAGCGVVEGKRSVCPSEARKSSIRVTASLASPERSENWSLGWLVTGSR
jgi:hypothetical protein